MKANPGGVVSPADVVGRRTKIDEIWETLLGDTPTSGQSVVLVAERRMGKTSVVRTMVSQPRQGAQALWRDVSGLNTTLEFVGRVVTDARPFFSKAATAKDFFDSLLHRIGGAEVGGVFKFPDSALPHWKEPLELAMRELSAANGVRVVLIWDEFPTLLQNIAKREGSAQAKELLSNLRSWRQTYPSAPRMIYTGSIGLHHVIGELRDEAAWPFPPLNDMRKIELPPLASDDATTLAQRLIAGENLGLDPNNEAAAHLAEQVDGVAFYIHHVVATMKLRKLPATKANVDQVVLDALHDAQDRWELANYRKRLKDYYDADAAAANVVLETVAASQPIAMPQLHAAVSKRLRNFGDPLSKRIVNGDRAALAELVALLSRDYYLRRNDDGNLCFTFEIVRRWWQLQ